MTHPAGYSIDPEPRYRVNASRRGASEKPRRCFRSPLTGKRTGGGGTGTDGGDALTIFAKMFRKRAPEGNGRSAALLDGTIVSMPRDNDSDIFPMRRATFSKRKLRRVTSSKRKLYYFFFNMKFNLINLIKIVYLKKIMCAKLDER